MKYANYQQFNQIRLQRESQQNRADFPGSFQQNIPPTLFETGFIFGATFDRDSSGNMIGTTPSVRLDWWNFWFQEESFPTQLGKTLRMSDSPERKTVPDFLICRLGASSHRRL